MKSFNNFVCLAQMSVFLLLLISSKWLMEESHLLLNIKWRKTPKNFAASATVFLLVIKDYIVLSPFIHWLCAGTKHTDQILSEDNFLKILQNKSSIFHTFCCPILLGTAMHHLTSSLITANIKTSFQEIFAANCTRA